MDTVSSYFDIEELPLTSKCDRSNRLVKPKDERWKSFPSTIAEPTQLKTLMKVKNLLVFDDDIFLTGYMRSGTTLISEMIWLIANNFDFNAAKTLATRYKLEAIEFDDFKQISFKEKKEKRNVENMSRPRLLKTHLPVQLLPDELWVKKPRMIHISREVKDVAISLYHINTHFHERTLSDSLQMMLDDHHSMSPYREHVLNYKNIPDYPNILYLTYESVVTNIDEAIRRVGEFLNVSISEENFEKLKNHLSFDSMKNNAACNCVSLFEKVNEIVGLSNITDDFIRKGKIGGYKDEMPEEFVKKFDEWMAKEHDLHAGFPKLKQ